MFSSLEPSEPQADTEQGRPTVGSPVSVSTPEKAERERSGAAKSPDTAATWFKFEYEQPKPSDTSAKPLLSEYCSFIPAITTIAAMFGVWSLVKKLM
jgi:hypothetical protein